MERTITVTIDKNYEFSITAALNETTGRGEATIRWDDASKDDVTVHVAEATRAKLSGKMDPYTCLGQATAALIKAAAEAHETLRA